MRAGPPERPSRSPTSYQLVARHWLSDSWATLAQPASQADAARKIAVYFMPRFYSVATRNIRIVGHDFLLRVEGVALLLACDPASELVEVRFAGGLLNHQLAVDRAVR